MAKSITCYSVLFDGPEDGPSGPAGDGTFIQRFRSERDANTFAKANTCYGRPCKVDKEENVPRRIAERWGVC